MATYVPATHNDIENNMHNTTIHTIQYMYTFCTHSSDTTPMTMYTFIHNTHCIQSITVHIIHTITIYTCYRVMIVIVSAALASQDVTKHRPPTHHALSSVSG